MKSISHKKIAKIMDRQAKEIITGMWEHIRQLPFMTWLRVAVKILFKRLPV